MDVTKDHASRHSEDDFGKQFLMLVDSGAGVIHVRASEILRAVVCLRKTILLYKGEYHEWDVVNGNRAFNLGNFADLHTVGDGHTDISEAFSTPLGSMRDGTAGEKTKFFVYVNPHVYMENNPHMTQIMLMYNEYLPSCKICVVLVTPDIPLPESSASDSILSLRFSTPGLNELRDSVETLTKDAVADFSGGLAIDNDDIDRICYAGAGMTLLQFETYLALGAVKAVRNEKEVLTAEDLIDQVRVGKTEIVNQSDILELYKSTDIADVGGMENLKEWVKKRQRCYSDDAKDFGIEPPKGMVLVGPPGCVSGDAEVVYRRGARNSGRRITLAELYEKFNGLPASSRGWDTSMPTYLHSLDPNGVMFYNRVISVSQAGVKPVCSVVLVSGERITLTYDHPVGLPGGRFVQAQNLDVGTHVLLRGSMKPVATGGKRLDARPPRRIENVKYHPYGTYHEDSEYYAYKRVPFARLVVEAHMNSLPVDEYVHALKHNRKMSETFKFLDPIMEVHHVDEDTMNDELSNLMVLEKAAHARDHAKLENFTVEYVQIGVVAAVEDAGTVTTYDVQMDLPANNFVANNFIVHNTGKSLVAKAIASELGVPLIRIDFGRVFSSYVGSSEQRIRTALRQVEAMSPCVLFCDEIDKGLGGIATGSGSDSGVSMRVLGSFLTWLQDCEYPVFTMVTANNIDGLPPELLRRGRFDAIFSTALPNPKERRDVLAIHLRKRGRDIEDFSSEEVDRIMDACDKYVPAEIESAVKDALINAFSANEDLTAQHIIDAFAVMVPISKAFAMQIERMNEWAKNNATPVSLTDEQRKQRLASMRNRTRVSTRRRI
jgi:ATP-dependent 26S proteasome regulatory subunit